MHSTFALNALHQFMPTTSLKIEKDWLFQFTVSSKSRLYRHVLFILFIILMIFNSKAQFIEPALTFTRIGLILFFILLLYSSMYVLVPRFLFKGNYGSYLLSVIMIITFTALGYSSLWCVLQNFKRPGVSVEPIGIISITFVVGTLIAASSAIKLFQRAILDNQRINELEKTTMRAEMEQLKNQINPHFLFNMLNNANVLTQKDPSRASQVIMKLSDLLRYQLYDSVRGSVLLTADIHFLEDFLNLEKVRRDHFTFVVSKEGQLSGVQVAPLLFITFVENAIKHNADQDRPSYVHLYFGVYGGTLSFKCVNSKPILPADRQEVGGLGLANIKRRLELIYPGKHVLEIENRTDTYTVQLNIQL